MLECVPNVSEGRDDAVIDALGAACGPALLDVHRDPDHHRSVFTLGSRDPEVTIHAVRALALAVADHVDLGRHDGVHPRLGALDVVPFVDLDGGDAAGGAADDFGRWISEVLGVPVFCTFADPDPRSLPAVRRGAFTTLSPDLGPPEPHPRLGAVAVGARPPMIAVNVGFTSAGTLDDVGLARAVARDVRGSDGGLPGVRALGFELASQGTAQVSMNLVDLDATGLEEACTAVRERLGAAGVEDAHVELVGLLPAAEWERTSREFRGWSGLSVDQTVEARLEAVGR